MLKYKRGRKYMKKFFRTILKMISTLCLIFLTPFILPLFLKIFLWLGWFKDINEFEEILKIFYSIYPLIYIAITIILLLWFFHKWDDIKNFFTNRELSLKFGNNEISSKRVQEVVEKNEINKKIIQENTKDVDNTEIINEAKKEFGLLKNTHSTTYECEKCNKKEIEKENDNLRFFAAYNLINFETKGILHSIYNENFMEADKFKKIIIDGYKKRNQKNIKFRKKDINKIADSKYETIYNGLKFLNIIEPSENDSEIKLTAAGKKFVKKYIEKGEV